MTIQQAHFEFKLEVDKLNTLSTPNLLPLQIDTLLNIAQEEFIKSRYQGNNAYQSKFEQNEKRFEDLSTLIKTFVADNPETPNSNPNSPIAYFKRNEFINKPNSILVSLPDDFFLAISEEADAYLNKDCKFCKATQINIQPISHDRYTEVISNPFRKPNEYNLYRLVVGQYEGKRVFEIIEGFNQFVLKYTLRYIKYPLQVSITSNTTFELPEHTHREIIQFAATNALRIIESQRYQANLDKNNRIE